MAPRGTCWRGSSERPPGRGPGPLPTQGRCGKKPSRPRSKCPAGHTPVEDRLRQPGHRRPDILRAVRYPRALRPPLEGTDGSPAGELLGFAARSRGSAAGDRSEPMPARPAGPRRSTSECRRTPRGPLHELDTDRPPVPAGAALGAAGARDRGERGAHPDLSLPDHAVGRLHGHHLRAGDQRGVREPRRDRDRAARHPRGAAGHPPPSRGGRGDRCGRRPVRRGGRRRRARPATGRLGRRPRRG